MRNLFFAPEVGDGFSIGLRCVMLIAAPDRANNRAVVKSNTRFGLKRIFRNAIVVFP
jgi:hypothetical protein